MPSESTIIITYVVEILPSAVDDSLFTSSCDISVSGLSMGTIENIEYITVPWDTEMQLFCSIDFGEETIEENEKQAIKDKIEKVGISVVDEKIEGTICIFGLNVSSDMSVLDAVDIVKSLDSRIIAVMPNIVLDVFDDDMIDGKEVYTETQSAMTTEATNTTEIPLTAEIAEPSQINKITSLPNDPLAIYSDIPVEPNQYYLYK